MISVAFSAEKAGRCCCGNSGAPDRFDLNEKADLVIALRAAKNYDPFLSRVAALGDNIVDHALLPVITIGLGESRIPALALAPVGVVPGSTALLSANRSVTGS